MSHGIDLTGQQGFNVIGHLSVKAAMAVKTVIRDWCISIKLMSVDLLLVTLVSLSIVCLLC